MGSDLIERISSRLRRDAGISLERTYLYSRSALAPTPITVSSDVELRIAPIRASEAHLLAALGPPDVAEWNLRFKRGDECFGAWVEGQLAHYSWVQLAGEHPISAAGVEVKVQDAEFWIYNCRTSDAHRGKRIYPRTLQHIALEYFRAGKRAGWIYTTFDNVASQHGIERAGFFKMRTLHALRLGRHYRRLGNDVTSNYAP